MQTTLPQPLKKDRLNAASENCADSPLRPPAPVPKPPPSQNAPNSIAMIIITRPDATEEQIDHIVSRIRNWGLKSEVSRGEHRVVIGVIGPEDKIREKPLGAFPGVESVTPVLKPYKLVAYEFRGRHSHVQIGHVTVGAKEVVIMAGPCSVESEEQITAIAADVRKSGAKILRGGAFKPRTSPYSFQGLGKIGLQLLAEARKLTGMPIITEVMDTKDLELVCEYADCLQIGARNMQNFALLREVGRTHLPVMLKRGMSATIKDLLMSAEYILSEGNFNVLLCERGIRTFETMTRNTLDLNAVPVLKSETHLPVVVDPTHGIGLREYIPSMALAAVAAGADSVMIEVHNYPELAKSDGEQALRPHEFDNLVDRVRSVANAVGREL
jgi:3-deoxy-7-phosphoheptulonate synthase